MPVNFVIRSRITRVRLQASLVAQCTTVIKSHTGTELLTSTKWFTNVANPDIGILSGPQTASKHTRLEMEQEESRTEKSTEVVWMGKKCTLVLGDTSITCEEIEEKQKFTVALEDTLGLVVSKLPVSSNSSVCSAELCTYQKEEPATPSVTASSSVSPNHPVRTLSKEVIEFSESDNFETNLKTAEEWREAILLQRLKNNRRIFVNSPEQGDKLEPLRLLVIINPVSGGHRSEQLYRENALPIFEMAGAVIVQELFTERMGHAKEFMQMFDLSTITGIVVASGDGIIREVINGLMTRPDWQTAIKTPIGLLPTGTANTVTVTLLDEACVRRTTQNAAFVIVNGGVQPNDIVSVIMESSRLYITDCIMWGLLGDIILETAQPSYLPKSLKFITTALKCILMKKTYHGRLSYLPIEDDSNSIAFEPITDGLPCPPTPLLPTSLSDPVPDNWITIEGDFVSLIAAAWRISDTALCIHPEKKLGSGDLCLLYGFEDVKRVNMLPTSRYFLSEVDACHTIFTRAFRLTSTNVPNIVGGNEDASGCSEMQVQVHPGMMRLFSRKRQ